MRFGKLLTFKVDGIPSKLAHYVVDKFKAKKMKIKTPSGHIKFDTDSIHRLLGVPKGGIKLYSITPLEVLEDKVKEWRDQYEGCFVAPSEIVRHIESARDEDSFEFRMDFVMLFVTVMIQCLKQGRLKEEILKYFIAETDFRNIDWCDYIIENLKVCKIGWNRFDNNSPFSGPLTVLMCGVPEDEGSRVLTISINNQTVGEMEHISLEFQEEYTSVLKKLDDFEEKKNEIENDLSVIYNKNIERSKVVSLMEKHELILQVKPSWPQDNSLKETNSKIGDLLKKINEEIVDGEIDGVNENEMEDNNIDIALDLEADDNLDVSQEFQKETTEIVWQLCNKLNVTVVLKKNNEEIVDEEIDGQNVEAWNIDFDKVPEVPKTVYVQKEVEEINQQTDKGTREKYVDVVEARKTTVDENNEATNEEEENVDVDMNKQMHENEKPKNEATSKLNEEGVKNVDNNDGPNYSLGLTQDGLILTPEGQINKDKEADEEVQKENEILGGEEDIETDIPLDVEPISQYFMIDNFHESIALVGIKDSEDYFKKDSTYKIVHVNRADLHKMYEEG
ncbi:hypothetical protein L1987_52718 [Smallanthus sonchifolius]|uniref:Uncharacterized protein n=1 Tax=Smallanthus sonchifolius TaxID=185202 RepID=A0ACB9ET91_9ASTR|nr:hypothetical protein L1987_52718 [Smallanthus sonchifolius]